MFLSCKKFMWTRSIDPLTLKSMRDWGGGTFYVPSLLFFFASLTKSLGNPYLKMIDFSQSLLVGLLYPSSWIDKIYMFLWTQSTLLTYLWYTIKFGVSLKPIFRQKNAPCYKDDAGSDTADETDNRRDTCKSLPGGNCWQRCKQDGRKDWIISAAGICASILCGGPLNCTCALGLLCFQSLCPYGRFLWCIK